MCANHGNMSPPAMPGSRYPQQEGNWICPSYGSMVDRSLYFAWNAVSRGVDGILILPGSLANGAGLKVRFIRVGHPVS